MQSLKIHKIGTCKRIIVYLNITKWGLPVTSDPPSSVGGFQDSLQCSA